MSSTYEYGPLRPYQIIWRSGHVETVMAHQVTLPQLGSFISAYFGTAETAPRASRLTVHGEVNGRWTLILDADYADVQSVRLLVDEMAELTPVADVHCFDCGQSACDGSCTR